MRSVLAIWLSLAMLLGPALCCCTARVAAKLTHWLDTETTKSAPKTQFSCCQSSTSKPAPSQSSQVPAPCPCKKSCQREVVPFTPEKSDWQNELRFDLPHSFADQHVSLGNSLFKAAKKDSFAQVDSCFFCTTDLLHTYQILRC